MVLLGWVAEAIATLFISLLDQTIYTFVAWSYEMFVAIANVNIFDTNGGQSIYEGFTKRLYTILSIVMVFFFAYQLILMIINPDGDTSKKSSTLIKDTIVSLIALAVLPTVFNYMAIFQNHVIFDNTIPALILGGNASKDSATNAGRRLSLIMFTAMYHPYNMEIGDFQDISLDDAKTKCRTQVSPPIQDKVCEAYYRALRQYESGTNYTVLFWNNDLIEEIHEDGGMQYIWFVSSAAGIMLLWLIVSYALDLGVRAVKLGVLELLAPIPIICRIFPQTRKTFETWLKELTSTYGEVFMRVLVLTLVVMLAGMVPNIINAVFTAQGTSNVNPMLKILSTIILILGILSFAKDAPELFKKFVGETGINFKPGVKKRINDNEYAMRGASMAAQGLGGMIAAGKKEKREGTNTGFGHALKIGLRGAQGAFIGGRNGLKNQMQLGEGFKNMQEGGQFLNSTLDNRKAVTQSAGTKTYLGAVLKNKGQDLKQEHDSMVDVMNGKKNTSFTDQELEFMKQFGEMMGAPGKMTDDDQIIKAYKKAREEAIADATKGKAFKTAKYGKTTDPSKIKEHFQELMDQRVAKIMSDDHNNGDVMQSAITQSIKAAADYYKKNSGYMNQDLLNALNKTVGGAGFVNELNKLNAKSPGQWNENDHAMAAKIAGAINNAQKYGSQANQSAAGAGSRPGGQQKDGK